LIIGSDIDAIYIFMLKEWC